MTPSLPSGASLLDPHDLALDLPFTRLLSIGQDPWSIWGCTVPPGSEDPTIGPGRMRLDLDDALATAEATAEYFDDMSDGRWRLRFTVGGTVSVASSEADGRAACVTAALDAMPAPVVSGGVLVVMDAESAYSAGGRSYSFLCDELGCRIEPVQRLHETRRAVVMPMDHIATAADGVRYTATLAHELGHATGWPHVFRDASEHEYDDPMDLMSAGPVHREGVVANSVSTMAFLRYMAGWIDPDEVAVHRSGSAVFDIAADGEAGTQMVAIPGEERGALITLEARARTGLDRAVPAEGVAVLVVDQRPYFCGVQPPETCGHAPRLSPALGTPGSTEHVLDVGGRADVHGVAMEVLDRRDHTFTVRVDGATPAIPRFRTG